jgi:hypothetical protein
MAPEYVNVAVRKIAARNISGCALSYLSRPNTNLANHVDVAEAVPASSLL